MLRHHAGVLQIRRFTQFWKGGLVIAEHQHMTFPGMLVMPCNAILGAQSPYELKITFPVLGAVLALGTRSDVKGKRIGLNAVPLSTRAMICGAVWPWKIR
ncbi:hypothetical protein D9M70_606800 [compost metagenome]